MIFWPVLQKLIEYISWPPRKLLTCCITLSVLIPNNLNPALSCLSCVLQQELENLGCCCTEWWVVFLGVFVYQQMQLIKAGCPNRFLPPSAHPTLLSSVTGISISGYLKSYTGNGLRSCFTCSSAPPDGNGANLEEGHFMPTWYLVGRFSSTISCMPYLAALAASSGGFDCLLTQRDWHTSMLLLH